MRFAGELALPLWQAMGIIETFKLIEEERDEEEYGELTQSEFDVYAGQRILFSIPFAEVVKKYRQFIANYKKDRKRQANRDYKARKKEENNIDGDEMAIKNIANESPRERENERDREKDGPLSSPLPPITPNPPIIPPERETEKAREKENPSSAARKSRVTMDYPDDFERFWKAYPRKQGKGAAYKSWLKIRPSPDETQILLTAINKAKQSFDWKKDNGQYIPHPATWLNQRRWEDTEGEDYADYDANIETEQDPFADMDETQREFFRTHKQDLLY